jgi:hypothetical protein
MSAIFSNAATRTSTAGLKKKPTYTEFIKYIEEDKETIRYPNRDATIMANSYQYNNLIAQSMAQMSAQSVNVDQRAHDDALLKEVARSQNIGLGKLRQTVGETGLRPARMPPPTVKTATEQLRNLGVHSAPDVVPPPVASFDSPYFNNISPVGPMNIVAKDDEPAGPTSPVNATTLETVLGYDSRSTPPTGGTPAGTNITAPPLPVPASAVEADTPEALTLFKEVVVRSQHGVNKLQDAAMLGGASAFLGWLGGS